MGSVFFEADCSLRIESYERMGDGLSGREGCLFDEGVLLRLYRLGVDGSIVWTVRKN